MSGHKFGRLLGRTLALVAAAALGLSVAGVLGEGDFQANGVDWGAPASHTYVISPAVDAR
ncbi:hypothetical protein K7640_19435 [Micromonospora sp. PLK6-60]|uniref:hypothetical protein n=1 Tax=Micromonospora sp. PLK6-60 TaxID=2873383 RepID=UPI001CA79CF0|nr:hypothetical protein [Micromonospora sp. PLK6-60]MBY8874004.1 hypothetical protein [Micromonospora sp. PLK6-60]